MKRQTPSHATPPSARNVRRALVSGAFGLAAAVAAFTVPACASVLELDKLRQDDSGVSPGTDGSVSAPDAANVDARGAGDAGRDACTYDEDCPTLVTTPAECASARCENAACVYIANDADGDGHGVAVCVSSQAVVREGDDCDDGDGSLYPGHPRVCAALADGTPFVFPGGAPRGRCAFGKQSCTGDRKVGPCENTVAPAREDTCTPTVDENCDGNPFDACRCFEPAQATCGTADVGECLKGTAVCTPEAGYGLCTGSVEPTLRDCAEARDNDCNGAIDASEAECECPGNAKPGAISPCNTHGDLDGVGDCRAGERTCTPNGPTAQWTECEGAVGPKRERCNDQDANCNGIPGKQEQDCQP